jgi:hypothetical protein
MAENFLVFPNSLDENHDFIKSKNHHHLKELKWKFEERMC